MAASHASGSEVSERSDARRQAAIDAHNRKVHVRPANFIEGDYVLRGARESQRGRKPQLKWQGPYQVIRVKSDYIFTIKDLRTRKTEDAHGRRLKFFRNSDSQVTEELQNHLSCQHGELLVMDEFLGIRRRKQDTERKVKWKVFESDETDWVSITPLCEDVPVLLEDYLNSLKDSGNSHECRLASSL